MQEIEIGCLVYRKSYERDILFKVSDIIIKDDKRIIILKGVEVRLEADADEEDLDVVESEQSKE